MAFFVMQGSEETSTLHNPRRSVVSKEERLKKYAPLDHN